MAKINGVQINGARTALVVMGSVLALVIVSIIGMGMREADKTQALQREHEGLQGHPRLLERTDGLVEDVAEIKVEQRKQGQLLSDIHHAVVKGD